MPSSISRERVRPQGLGPICPPSAPARGWGWAAGTWPNLPARHSCQRAGSGHRCLPRSSWGVGSGAYKLPYSNATPGQEQEEQNKSPTRLHTKPHALIPDSSPDSRGLTPTLLPGKNVRPTKQGKQYSRSKAGIGGMGLDDKWMGHGPLRPTCGYTTAWWSNIQALRSIFLDA